MTPGAAPLMRVRGGHEGHQVTPLELFFDLVFVLGITQLSHYLLKHFTLLGGLQTLVLLLAVWWVWVFTAWVTNWLNPARPPVRLMVLALMLLGLLLASGLGSAFGPGGLLFALTYVLMQVGRSVFALWAMWGDPVQRRNFLRLTAWLGLGAALWLAGGLANGPLRLGLWLLALVWDYAGPAMGFALPGLGRSTTREWSISGEHMAERAGLFVIIALGEGLLVSGGTFAGMAPSTLSLLALALTFISSVALWWTYFVANAEVVAASIRRSDDPGRLGRYAYTYLHVPMVAGLVLAATGGEVVLAHAADPPGLTGAAAVVGGPALFLIGNLLFKRSATAGWPRPQLVGVLALLVLGVLGTGLPAVVLSALVAMALVGVALWEQATGVRVSHLGAGELTGQAGPDQPGTNG